MIKITQATEKQGQFTCAFIKSKHYIDVLIKQPMETARETGLANEQEELAQRIATGHGFKLYKQYRENCAAKLIGLKAATLKRRRMAGQIAHIRKGPRKVTYFGFQIASYLITSIEPCQTLASETTKLENFGSPKTYEVKLGAERGMTPLPNKHGVLVSAQQILRRPKSV